MKTLAISAITLALVAASASPAFAGHRDLDQRRETQEQRIHHGVDTGELTRREAKQLWKEQRKIGRLAKEFKSDGRLSWREARILDECYDASSRRIHDLKHNERVARRSCDKRFSSWCGQKAGHRDADYWVRRLDL